MKLPKVLYATLTQEDPEEPIEVAASDNEVKLMIETTGDPHDTALVGVYELKETRLLRLSTTALPKKEN